MGKFWSGFGEKFRKGFDKKYYEQLCEDTFKYERRLPIDYINHLQNCRVKVDMLVIKHLKKHFFRGWEEDKHIISYKVRLEKERKKLRELATPIQITDDQLKHNYVEEMLKRANCFGQKCCTDFEALPAIQKQWPAPATHYEKRNTELEDYEQLGSQRNPYAPTNSAAEMQNTIQIAMASNMASMHNNNTQALNAR